MKNQISIEQLENRLETTEVADVTCRIVVPVLI